MIQNVSQHLVLYRLWKIIELVKKTVKPGLFFLVFIILLCLLVFKIMGNAMEMKMSLYSLFVPETQKIILFGKSTEESKNNTFKN